MVGLAESMSTRLRSYPKAHFLGLPREARDMCYELVFEQLKYNEIPIGCESPYLNFILTSRQTFVETVAYAARYRFVPPASLNPSSRFFTIHYTENFKMALRSMTSEMKSKVDCLVFANTDAFNRTQTTFAKQGVLPSTNVVHVGQVTRFTTSIAPFTVLQQISTSRTTYSHVDIDLAHAMEANPQLTNLHIVVYMSKRRSKMDRTVKICDDGTRVAAKPELTLYYDSRRPDNPYASAENTDYRHTAEETCYGSWKIAFGARRGDHASRPRRICTISVDFVLKQPGGEILDGWSKWHLRRMKHDHGKESRKPAKVTTEEPGSGLDAQEDAESNAPGALIQKKD